MSTSGSNKVGNESEKQELTSEQLLAKLRAALQRDGDFPASAKVVSELRMLVTDPKTSANQITELILREPSLGTRVLHLVNSTYYRRAKPIMTVSQAVMQIGMKPLSEMCAGLVLLQKFVPQARRGGPFAECIQKTIVTSLLSSTISDQMGADQKTGKAQEAGYLAGSLAEIGTLLLAYYFPQIYDNAVKRSKTKNVKISQSIKEITGVSPVQLSLEVVTALNLPPFYREVLLQMEPSLAASYPSKGEQVSPMEKAQLGDVSKSVSSAKNLSNVLVFGRDRSELESAMNTARGSLGIETKRFDEMIGKLPELFKSHCASLDVNLPALPDYVSTFGAEGGSGGAAGADDGVTRFIEEIKQAVQTHEPTSSVITSVMETLAWGMKFDRVLLMLANQGKKKLLGRMLLGTVEHIAARDIERPLGDEASPRAPDAEAFVKSHPVYNGDPVFPEGWPFVAIPVGFGPRAVGVVYADRIAKSEELSSREQANIGILAELLDRSIKSNA